MKEVISLTSFKDQNVKRQLIMKHYKTPDNKGDISSFPVKVDHYSTKCVDQVHLGLKIENGLIQEIKFQAEGCAVFLSSVDIMINQIKGKSVTEAKEIVAEYEKLINVKPANTEILNELNIYDNVATHVNRLHCAEMISDALKKVI